MEIPRVHRTVCALMVAVAGACGGDTPVSPQAAGGADGARGTPPASDLQLLVPRAIAPGRSVQLMVNAVSAGGATEDVTDRASWTIRSATGSDVLSLTSTGLAIAGQEWGESVVTARFNGRTAEASVLVLPEHTFRLQGVVSTDGASPDNVRVSVISGPGAGLTTLTNQYGQYVLYGVGGNVEIRSTKDGLLERMHLLEVTWDRTFSFEMTAGRAVPDYRGRYTLVVTTDADGPSCPRPMPDEWRRRVYTAAIDQTGADLKVTLSGANLTANTFRGAVDAGGNVTFWLRPAALWDYDVPDVAENLNDGTTICVAGTILARSGTAGLFGTVSQSHGGTIYRCSGSHAVHAGCSITSFELMRR
jgi:hypothetical protein